MVDAAWCKVRDGLASNSLYQYKIVGDWVMTNDTNIGSSFDAFLQEESILVEVKSGICCKFSSNQLMA